MRFLVILLSSLAVMACAREPQIVTQSTHNTSHNSQIYHQLVKELALSLNEDNVLTQLSAPLVSTAFVWIDTYQLDQRPSTFQYMGMSLEEAVATELIKQDVKIREYKVKPSIALEQEGGYYLSRTKSEVSGKIKAQYILVGTLSPLENGTTVNAKVIDHQTGDVISSAYVHFPYSSQYNRQINMVSGSISRGEG